MKVVVDTNILFSALLSENSSLRQILLTSSHSFYCPMDVIHELYKNFDKLIKCSKSQPDEIQFALLQLFSKINFIDDSFISDKSYQNAFNLCRDYDESDTPFVALSLELQAELWTGDKIKTHLKNKEFENLFEY